MGSSEVSTPKVRRAACARAIEAAFDAVAPAHKSTPLVTGALVALLWGRRDHAVLVGVFLVLNALMAACLIQLRQYRRSKGDRVEYWRWNFTLGALIYGLVWGGAFATLIERNDLPGNALVAMFAAGLTAGGLATHLTLPLALHGFHLGLLVPIATALAWWGGDHGPTLALVVGIFGFVITAVGRSTARVVGDALDVREHNTELTRSLRAESDRNAATIAAMRDGVVTLGRDGRIVAMNRSAERLTGWGLEEAKGRHVRGVIRLESATEERGMPDVIRQRLLPREGDALSVEVSVTRLPDGSSLWSLHDLSGREALERERLSLLNEKLDSVGRLAGGIADGFNNQLGALRGHLDLLAASPIPEDARAHLREAQRSTQEAERLAGTLVPFSPGSEPIKRELRIADILEQAIPKTHRDAISALVEAGCGTLHADGPQLRSAVFQLVRNAIESGSRPASIEIEATVAPVEPGDISGLGAGDYVDITVRDRGRGIPPSVLPKVMEPYFSTARGRNGLGLALARAVARRHRGELFISSSATGTAATLRLPIGKERSARPAQTEDTALRVLVIDDHEGMRRACGTMLSFLGHTPAEAPGFADALSQIEQAQSSGRPFDLLLVDLVLGEGESGTDLIQQLRAHEDTTPAIACSGYSDSEAMAFPRMYGFQESLPKPFDLEQLREALQRIRQQRPASEPSRSVSPGAS